MPSDKTGKRQKLFLPVELMDVLKWHVAEEMRTSIGKIISIAKVKEALAA